MATGIFKGGKELSSKQVKSYIMRSRGWTEQEYTLARKGLTKQITGYNRAVTSKGGEKFDSTAVQLLYKQSKAMKRYGRDYMPTEKIKFIQALPKTSGSARSMTQITKIIDTFDEYVTDRFEALVNANPIAKQISDHYQNDPVKREKALRDFADDMHVIIDNNKKELKSAGVLFGGYGSGNVPGLKASAYIDFDEPNLVEVPEKDLPFEK